MARYFLSLFLFLSVYSCAFSQSSEPPVSNDPLIGYSAYLDLFYSYAFNKPSGNSRLPYIYHYNRHNEVNLNHGYLKVYLDHSKYRANLALQTGTFVVDNYTNEPDYIKAIFDANVGFSLNSENSLWLDVGIFGNSHIGTESTEGWSNWTASRTLLSENVPYYQSGINLSYTNQDWYLSFLILNGWQRIQRVQGNSLPSFGTQTTYSGIESLVLNWSTFIGTEYPDNQRRMRYFSHLSAQIDFSNRWELILGWDTGIEQEFNGSSSYNSWNGILTVIRYAISEKWKSAFRYEYYSDPNSVLVSSPSANGYRTSGLSSNFDYLAYDNILCRIEARYFLSPDDIYEKDNAFTASDFALLASIIVNINNQ